MASTATTDKERHLDRSHAALSRGAVERSLYFALTLACTLISIALIWQRPYLVRLIMTAGLHTQTARFAIQPVGTETLAAIGIDQIADQRIFPSRRLARAARLHHQLAARNRKAAPRGFLSSGGSNCPCLRRTAITISHASRSGETATVTFNVVLFAGCDHRDRARTRRRSTRS
jgi:hypothetical protein